MTILHANRPAHRALPAQRPGMACAKRIGKTFVGLSATAGAGTTR
jgi:hypothetical protein